MAQYRPTTPNSNQPRIPQQEPAQASRGEKQIPVDGFRQVVEMLQAADPAFRESLLARIGRRDPALARSLREQF